MHVLVSSVDYNPPELNEQVPFGLALLRALPGPDRPDYWLGRLDRPIRWIDDSHERLVEHVVLCARWVGTQIVPGFANLPVGIAYVTDPTQLNDEALSFDKCRYVAIGIASEVNGRKAPPKLANIVSGRITRAFGLGETD